MAFQLKYWLEYKSLKVGSSDTFRLELWQNTATVLTAEEIKGAQSPFILEMPELNHKFQVVRGRGCTINLLSDTDFKFFAGLEHIDPQEFKIIHKINSVANWVGYLNSDMQSEPYDVNQNYIVSTTGNDGFALMDRFRFLQADESKYIGLKSKWELIQICLGKIGLTYNDIKISLSTTYSGFSGDADKTILHESFVNCANFYDEDGLGMTLREVLESILAPYGAFICQDSGSIYITDIHTIAGNSSVTFKKYNATTYAHISNVAELIEKDVYDVNYFGTGQSIDRSGGTNLQRVIYSPYPKKDVINESIVRPEEFAVIPESFSTKDGYAYRTLVGHIIWQNIPLTQSTFEESFSGAGEHFVYYRYPGGTLNTPVLELIDEQSIYLSISDSKLSNVISIPTMVKRFLDGVALLVSGKVLTKTKDNPYNETYTPAEISAGADKVTELYINFETSIGDLYYNQSIDSWTTTPTSDCYINVKNDNSVISNQWTDFSTLITLGSFSLLEEIYLYGFFIFKIRSNTKIRIQGEELSENDSLLDEVWIRNLSFKLVNRDGSEIQDSDIEYLGHLNKLYAQEGENITLTCGTQSRFSDNAKIIRSDGDGYADILEWTRAGQTYKIEELLLNSLCSNYRVNFVSLLAMKLKNEFSLMTTFTDTTFLEANPKLMIKSSTIDYANYSHDVNLIEISEDELIIVKE